MSYAQVETEIVRWAEARCIIQNATPQSQLNKALEELAELFKGVDWSHSTMRPGCMDHLKYHSRRGDKFVEHTGK